MSAPPDEGDSESKRSTAPPPPASSVEQRPRNTEPGLATGAGESNRGLWVLVAGLVVLSSVALVFVASTKRLLNSAGVGEATQMIQSIRVAQESYRAENGHYANVSATLDERLCPLAPVNGKPVPWDSNCPGGGSEAWSVLPLHVEGPLRFRYASVAGKVGEDLPRSPTGMPRAADFGGSGKGLNDWFVSSAKGDTDGNGAYVFVVATSWSNAVFVDNEGE